MARFHAYDWPGNVRELHNEIQRMVAMSEDDAPLRRASAFRARRFCADARPTGMEIQAISKAQVEALERGLIARTLEDFGGNISKAADRLGLSRVGLRAKMERYDLRKDGPDDA